MAAADTQEDGPVKFERGVDVCMMAIDGTWRRSCVMTDVSPTGATLTAIASLEGLQLKEFFLLLSTTGLAYRRCSLAYVNGDKVGVTFIKTKKASKAAMAAARSAAALNS